MKLNPYNHALAVRLLSTLRAFGGDESYFDVLQSSLNSAAWMFENDGSDVAGLVRAAEADVETIRFTRRSEEQSEEIAARMEMLVRNLELLLGD